MPWSRDRVAARPSPPLTKLLRAGTLAIGLSLVLAGGVAIASVVITRHAAHELADVVGPLRTDNSVILRLVHQGDSAVRGYQVTGEEVTLEPFTAMADVYLETIASLRERAAANDEWLRLVNEQDAIAIRWYEEYAAPVILLVADGDPDGVSDEFVATGQELVAEIREVNLELDRRLQLYSEEHLDEMQTRTWIAVAVIGVILGAAVATLYWRNRRVRRLVADPLERMVVTVNSFQQGDLGVRSDVRGSLEVDALAKALNDVASWAEHLIQAERQRLEQARLIREVTSHVREGLDEHDVLDRTVRALGPAVGADRALILALNDEGELGGVRAEWVADGFTALGRDGGGQLPIDRNRDAAIRSGIEIGQSLQLANVADANEIRPASRAFLESIDVGAMLITPVITSKGPTAAIVLLTHGRTYDWPPEAEPLTTAVADDLATALTHARLYKQEAEMVRQLRELDQAQSDFVSSVSHELRTPLTSIRGYVEMLADGDAGELDAEQLEMLAVVERNADRLLALIEDLLTLSRIESGSFRAALAPVHLSEITEALLAEMDAQPSGNGVQLISEIDSDLPPVLGDASQLERVLMNLLSNAIKFSPDGGLVRVRASVDGDEVVLEVSDEGVGIPLEDQDKLFNRFFRSSVAQERAIQGTGLGLVIVKSIVENHHGRIDVCSRPGEGTRFSVRLPTAPIPAAVR